MLSRIAGVLTSALILAGCGGGGEVANLPETVPVTGTVIYSGSPIEEGTVTFYPQEVKANPATGVLSAGGKFELSTYERGDGAVPGTHKVVVESITGDDVGGSGGESLVPEIYSSLETTPLTVTVGPDGESGLELVLEDQ